MSTGQTQCMKVREVTGHNMHSFGPYQEGVGFVVLLVVGVGRGLLLLFCTLGLPARF